MKRISFLLLCLLTCVVSTMQAQVKFAKDKLYNIVPIGQSKQAIGYKSGTTQAVLLPLDGQDQLQQWSITDLSGSFRFITPFENKAINATSDNTAGITENHGSDESQLLAIRQKGKTYQLIPSNRMSLILTCDSTGNLSFKPAGQVSNEQETLFLL